MAVDDELQRYLQSLPQKVRAKLSGKVREQGERLSARQKSALQSLETDPEETGGLDASCQVVAGRDDCEVIVQAGGNLTTDAKGHDHALDFEFGTRKQPARPFFYPTARAMQRDIRENIEDAVSEALK